MTTAAPQHHRIIALEADNLKRLKAVKITPKGDVVVISGDNDSGKTSVLDAIWWALGGGNAAQAKPIREGEEEGKVVLDLGTLKVTRRFRFKKDTTELVSSITVETADGAKYASPQAMLDNLIDGLTFDPLAFARMKGREQYDALKGLVAGIDFDAEGKIRREHFEARTTATRLLKEYEITLAAFTIPDGVPDEPVSVDKLLDALNEMRAKNRTLANEEESRREFRRQYEERQKEANALAEEIAILTARLKTRETGLTSMKAEIDGWTALPPALILTETESAIKAAGSTNELVSAKKARNAVAEKVESQKKRVEELTGKITEVDARVAKAIEAANFPVPGLTLGDGEVLLNGHPFDQASTAQKLRASMAIAAGRNPRLRVMVVREGSVLDAKGMEAIAKFAAENDMQVWVERVGAEANAFVLEDGHLKE